MSIRCLADHGQSQRQIARILGVGESTVRYHLQRLVAGASDGRARQTHLASGWSEAIATYFASLERGR